MSDLKARASDLWRFVALSLVAHLFLLSRPISQFQVQMPGAPALSAWLRGSPAAAPEHQGSDEKRPASEVLAEPKQPSALVRPRPRDSGPLAATAASTGASGRAAGGTGPVVAEPTRTAGGTKLGAANLDAVRQYILQLVPGARRHKHYPRLAQEKGWEGTTEVAIRPGALGGSPQLRVSRSSGYALLDEQALATMAAAVLYVDVPEELRRQEVEIAVPVQFRIGD